MLQTSVKWKSDKHSPKSRRSGMTANARLTGRSALPATARFPHAQAARPVVDYSDREPARYRLLAIRPGRKRLVVGTVAPLVPIGTSSGRTRAISNGRPLCASSRADQASGTRGRRSPSLAAKRTATPASAKAARAAILMKRSQVSAATASRVQPGRSNISA